MRDSAGKARPRETPQVLAEEALRTARGKRVPVAEINGPFVQDIKNCRPSHHCDGLFYIRNVWKTRSFFSDCASIFNQR